MLELRGAPVRLGESDIAWVKQTLAGMSDDDKLRHLFCLVIYDDDEKELTRLAREVRPCGVMLRPFRHDEALHASGVLQRESEIPMLLAANLESGGAGIDVDGTSLGSEMQVAATGEARTAARLGTICGREARAVGANWAFAPIIDIDYNFRNPITNTRTFGSDPTVVRDMGRAYVTAVQREGVAASIKHFPGDGVDERDQHLAVTVNSLSCEDWDAAYGEAYRAGIEAGALTVMIGHIMQPAYSRRLRPGIKDEDILPASLSPELIGGLLRERLGFNGLVVSDATSMAGFMAPLRRKEAVPRCIAAGCDVFLFSKNYDEDLEAMRWGFEAGVITRERLDEAVTRILALKAALGLHRDRAPKALADEALAEHRRWAQECADESVTLIKNKGGVLPLSPDKHRRVLLYPLESEKSFFAPKADLPTLCDRVEKRLREEGFEVSRFEPSKGMEGRSTRYSDIVDSYDLLLYVANLQTRSNQTTVRIEWAMPMGANCPVYAAAVPTVFLSFANPYHLLDAPRVPVYVNAYASTDPTIDAVIDKLLGRSPFKGRSPVDAFCGKWDTHL